MKIITWNCNMAFRKKADVILAYQPDILVVQECECPEKLIFNTTTQKPTDILWFGTNQHKGLAIFSYGNYRLHVIEGHNQDLKIIAPVYVTNGETDFNLMAVWAHNPNDPDGRYVEQVWKAIHHYDHVLSSSKTILAGDFNSNAIWDKEHRAGSHSDVVKRLAEKGICSAYHLHHEQTQGQEAHPTFYLYRHQLKPYHLDYCFASKDFADKIQSVEIGEHEFWKQHSDHVPLMVTFDIN